MQKTQNIGQMGNLNLSDLYKQYAQKQYIAADGQTGIANIHYINNGPRNNN